MGEGDIVCIPNTEEKYISFSKSIYVKENKFKYKIRFADSFKFMSSSLDELVSNLKPDQLKHTCHAFGDDCELLFRNGVFPYDWFHSFDKLNKTQLPLKEAFYSKLYNSEISHSDYVHAQKVWNNFGIKTFREYHDLYMKSDVLLLTDVFENFRDMNMKYNERDPAWYYTAPGLAWDACLKKSGVKLELLNDVNMLLMIERGIRGGVSNIPTRYSKANNKYMNVKFVKTEKSIFIV